MVWVPLLSILVGIGIDRAAALLVNVQSFNQRWSLIAVARTKIIKRVSQKKSYFEVCMYVYASFSRGARVCVCACACVCVWRTLCCNPEAPPYRLPAPRCSSWCCTPLFSANGTAVNPVPFVLLSQVWSSIVDGALTTTSLNNKGTAILLLKQVSCRSALHNLD